MSVPGCVNGKLEDPRAYFMSLVAGTSAADYPQVLARIEPDLNRYWIAVQHSGSGEIRPRLHLPVAGRLPVPSDTVWHDVDVEALPNPEWQWIDRWPHGAYTPAPCGGVEPPEPVPPSDLEARVTAIEARLDRHLKA